MRLTLKNVGALPWAKRNEKGRVLSYSVRDTEVRGLMVTVHANSKVYTVQRDLYSAEKGPDGKRAMVGTRRVKLGDVRDFGTVDEARDKAREVIALMRQGIDPNKPPEEPKKLVYTLGMAAEGYLDSRERMGRQASTIKGYRKYLRLYLAHWADRPLEEIGHDTFGVDALHRSITKEHGPICANQTMRFLRAVYRYARRKQRDLPPPPTEAVDFNKEVGRKTFVQDWPSWWEAVQNLPSAIARDWYLFLAFTGMRRAAAGSARVEHFDPKNGFLHVPKPKGGEERAFDLPLSDYVVGLLQERIAENRAVFGEDCPWIFPSARSQSGHLTGVDARHLGLPSPHVMRHSFVTAAKAAGLADYDVKLLVNHKIGDVTGGYIHGTELGDHLRRCTGRVTAYLQGRIHGEGKVVPLRAKVA
ncbi:tyrosine-type recombinase/integrase [Microbulbifer hydrolyticus]|uniref:Integrase n=1 Tax=Microbulbifer hydrolyticus TaxID=48074 RepID=A0A6P1TG43_9GAMM|nr:tyrosine-type recombinase/integrase [Microbulbifer hydrolyticus]MBB5212624.1 integrase [Microbulbifer hydrolyticus]QHQ40229.1 tyrosine-type recombinase/integrase [Microbulbifer hydrolyticus]